ICNNHDFYWEGGKSETEIKYHKAKPGPRDHYFTNYHLEELFSTFEMIYPWKSKSWFLLNINPEQSSTLIDRFEHNPANTGEICTAIDTEKFKPIKGEKRRKEILSQISEILSGYKKELTSISIDKIIEDEKFKLHPHPFITGFDDDIPINFINNNFILLQPTRIIERKCIEIDFVFLKKLLEKRQIRRFFEKEKYNNIIIIITGPIVIGHYEYFYKILAHFKAMLYKIDLEYRNKVFLAFLLSEIDKPLFIKRYDNPIKIHDIFSIASLITLPSETEGRGLPIIEAASCEVPIITRRYYPEEVYSKVVGEDLPEKDRFKVFEFRNNELDNKFINDLVQSLGKDGCEFMKHNRMVVKKRYSFELLKNDLEKA
ncbi:MAG: glycosyltransferase, partial [Candidatus Cloacimonetes bacterium]|nr:glycosyltransferase [Candidatus Cloacimonadota bacterium]